jgi:hypothetical protein
MVVPIDAVRDSQTPPGYEDMDAKEMLYPQPIDTYVHTHMCTHKYAHSHNPAM